MLYVIRIFYTVAYVAFILNDDDKYWGVVYVYLICYSFYFSFVLTLGLSWAHFATLGLIFGNLDQDLHGAERIVWKISPHSQVLFGEFVVFLLGNQMKADGS